MQQAVKHALVTLGIWAFLPANAIADFDDLAAAARGESVYFYAWGGSTHVNDYIAWAGDQVESAYGIDLVHVRLDDTSEAIVRISAEMDADPSAKGSADLVWINGENFRFLKENGLLFGPFTSELPNFANVDVEGKPTTILDFSIPTDGLESPWGMAQFVVIHDSEQTPNLPRTLDDLNDWARSNPQRMTYPSPPDFIGTTLLKHFLFASLPEEVDPTDPPPESAEQLISPVIDRLRALHPFLWRGGESFPSNGPALHQLFEDGEVFVTFAFNPAEAANLVLANRFPSTTRSFVFEEGSIANTHFVAIPANSHAKEAAMVVANFLLSPTAQAHKQDPIIWGDANVLDLERLSSEERALFERIEAHPAMAPLADLSRSLPEPHPAWVPILVNAWQQEFGAGN